MIPFSDRGRRAGAGARPIDTRPTSTTSTTTRRRTPLAHLEGRPGACVQWGSSASPEPERGPPLDDVFRTAIIAIVAVAVARLVIPKLPVINGLAAYI